MSYGQSWLSLFIILSRMQKFNVELVVFVPGHDRDFDGGQRFCLSRLSIQQRNVKVLVNRGDTM